MDKRAQFIIKDDLFKEKRLSLFHDFFYIQA